jgi:PAS domain S-box-containing protein
MNEILDRAPCGFITFNDNGEITFINGTLLETLGYAREDLLGKPVDKILPVASRIFYQTHFFPLLKLHGKVEEVYFSLQTRTGEHLPMLVNAKRYEAEPVPFSECVLIQIRQRSEYEDELLRAKREAEEAVRAKDEFLAMISHELRTPLSSIKGWSKLLREGKMKPEDTGRAYDAIARSTDSLANLIDDLLDFSRIVSGKLQIEVSAIDLTDVIYNTIEIVRPSADARSIEIETVIDDTAPVSGDAMRLQQVLWNLLSNSIKFTPKHGKVTVRVGRENSSVQVSVSDTGEGISPEFLPFVFDRFRQADVSGTRRHGGLGLGMSISRRLVELHGGTIMAESEGLGKGSTFYVRLPVLTVKAQSTVVSAPDDNAQLPGLSDISVLIVEDDAEARQTLKTILEHAGAQVAAAATVTEALDHLAAGPPTIMISDIEMPDGDGYSLIKSVRSMPDERIATLPAIALTANARPSERVRSLEAGYQLHMVKPVEPLELVLAIANLTNPKRAMATV